MIKLSKPVLLIAVFAGLFFSSNAFAVRWDFDSTVENWRSRGDATIEWSANEGGNIFMWAKGSDPGMVKDVSLGAASHNVVRIKISTYCPDKTATLYFKRSGSSTVYTGDTIYLSGGQAWSTYEFNMRCHSEWRGTITQLRIDPAGNCGSYTDPVLLGIDWIETDYQANNPPIVNFTPHQTKISHGWNLEVNIQSHDPDGDQYHSQWRVNSGNWHAAGTNNGNFSIPASYFTPGDNDVYVRATDTCGAYGQPAPQTVTDYLVPDNKPGSLSPGNGITLNIHDAYQFVFGGVANAHHYQVIIAPNSQYSSLIYNQEIPGSPFWVSDDILKPGNTYYWKICSENLIQSQGPWAEAWFKIEAEKLEPPNLTNPTDNELLDGPPYLFSWEAVPDAGAYQIKISTRRDFANTIVNEENISGSKTQYTYDKHLPQGTTHYWQMRALNQSGTAWGQWSAVKSFITQAQFTLKSPIDGVQVTGNTVTFDWSDIDNVDYYEIIVDNNEGLGSPEIHKPGIHQEQLTESQYEVTNWLGDNLYHWQVIAHMINGTTIASEKAVFTYQMREASKPVWQPLFRLYKGGDTKDHFYTTMTSQAQAAMDDGYTYERRECYVSDRKFAGGTPLFRLYNSNIESHYYTTSSAAKDDQIAHHGYQYEGIQGWVYGTDQSGAQPLYRIKQPQGDSYHYFMCMRNNERRHALDHPDWGFLDDGIAGYAYPIGLCLPLAHSRPQGNYGGVDMATRAFRKSHQSSALSLSGYGPAMRFSHTYNSFDHFQAVLGPGWTHSYYVYLLEDRDHAYVIVKWGNGSESHFQWDDANSRYLSLNGEKSTLTRQSSSGEYILTSKNQTRFVFHPYGDVGADAPVPGIFLKTITDKNGNRLSLSWQQGKLTHVTADNGHAFTFGYTEAAFPYRLTRVRENALGRHVDFAYDEYGRLISFSDARGKTTTYAYNDEDFLVAITRPEGNTYRISYNNDDTVRTLQQGSAPAAEISRPAASITRVRTPGGNTIDFKTEEFRLTRLIDGRTRPLDLTYADDDNPNQPTTVTYRAGSNGIRKEIHYTYDDRGNLTRITNHLGRMADFTYFSDNTLKSRTGFHAPGQSAHTTTYHYDNKGNPTGIDFPDQTGRQFSYDSHGLVASATDGRGYTSFYTYNGHGNLLTQTDPEGNVTRFTYDAAGRPVAIQDAAGKYTRFDYDANDNLIRSEDHTRFAVTARWDANNNPDRISWTRGGITSVTSYGFDNRDRLTAVTDPLQQVTHYAYNADGSLDSQTDRRGIQIDYAYDANGLLRAVTDPDHTRVIDRFDNGLVNDITGPAGVTQFTYTALDQVKQVIGPYNQKVQYEYDSRNNLSKIIYPGGLTVIYGYDRRQRLVTVESRFNGASLGITVYSYDAAGNVKNIERPNNTSATYVYDKASRLTGLTEKDAAQNVICSYAYTLDEAGNHQAVAVEEALVARPQSAAVSYTYNRANQLLTAGAVQYSHDANGNRRSSRSGGRTTTYDWNAENMLVRINGPDRDVRYVYDGLNNRIAKTVDGTTTRYVLDLAADPVRVLAETDGNGDIMAYYVYGLGLVSRIDRQGSRHFFHYNNRGDTVALTDDSGNVTDRYAHDEYGCLLDASGPTPNPFTFVGRYGVMAEGQDLYFMRARYYDAATGRFLKEDPLSFDGGDWNLYAYVGGNPLTIIDPSGLGWVRELFDIAIGLGEKIAEGVTRGFGANASPSATDAMQTVNEGLIVFAEGLKYNIELNEQHKKEIDANADTWLETFGYKMTAEHFSHGHNYYSDPNISKNKNLAIEAYLRQEYPGYSD